MFFLEHQYGYGLRRTDHLISCAAGGRLPRTIIPRPKLLEQTCQVAEWSGHDYHSLLRGVHCCNHNRVVGCLSLVGDEEEEALGYRAWSGHSLC